MPGLVTGDGGRMSFSSSGFSMFEPVPTMIRKVAKKMEREAIKRNRANPTEVQRVLDTLPVLSACNDLRALTELEPANKALFQSLNGIRRMIDYLKPTGPHAPYATHVARTLPCVMDADARKMFHDYARQYDRDGQIRYEYLLALLMSSDPDDREHACLAIASVAQDSPTNVAALFQHGISAAALEVLQATCRAQVPRQRLQRVVVMALSELANDFEPFKNALRDAGGVPLLLQMLTPTNDPFVIKETLQLLGRITQASSGIQADLQRYNAVTVYSTLLFAQDILHDATISELAALALVNLISEVRTSKPTLLEIPTALLIGSVRPALLLSSWPPGLTPRMPLRCVQVPASLKAVESHARYSAIRYEILASMARALSSSMQRKQEDAISLPGSSSFAFWGACASGSWGETTAGGDRMHTSFTDNPQFVLRAAAGTNMCIMLQDVEEDQRQRDKVKTRPLFLRLCVAEASRECLENRLKMLDINSSGEWSRSCPTASHRPIILLSTQHSMWPCYACHLCAL